MWIVEILLAIYMSRKRCRQLLAPFACFLPEKLPVTLRGQQPYKHDCYSCCCLFFVFVVSLAVSMFHLRGRAGNLSNAENPFT